MTNALDTKSSPPLGVSAKSCKEPSPDSWVWNVPALQVFSCDEQAVAAQDTRSKESQALTVQNETAIVPVVLFTVVMGSFALLVSFVFALGFWASLLAYILGGIVGFSAALVGVLIGKGKTSTTL